MNWFTLYLLTRCDALSTATGAAGIIGAIILVIGGGCMIAARGDQDIDSDTFWKLAGYWKKGFICWVLAILMHIAVPSNKQLGIILAGYWATNSEEVKQLPDNVVKTLNDFLEQYQEDDSETSD